MKVNKKSIIKISLLTIMFIIIVNNAFASEDIINVISEERDEKIEQLETTVDKEIEEKSIDDTEENISEDDEVIEPSDEIIESEKSITYLDYYKYNEEKNNSNEYEKNLYNSNSIVEALKDYVIQQVKKGVTDVDVSSYNILVKDVNSVLNQLMYEDEIFFIKDLSYTHDGQKVYTIRLNNFLTTSQINTAFNTINSEVTRYKNGINANWSDLEKILYTNDFLCHTCDYATNEKDSSHTLYGALVEKTPVCDGYSHAFRYLLKQIGIDSKIATSLSMVHAWNLVKLNGQYYHVDVTWNDGENDDPKGVGMTCYKYFLVSDSAITKREHNNWSTDVKATSTAYDNAAWVEVKNYLVYKDNKWYYTDYLMNKNYVNLNRLDLRKNIVVKENVKQIGVSDYTFMGPGLTTDGSKLYFSTSNNIYMCDFNGNNMSLYYNLPNKSLTFYTIEIKNNSFYYDTLDVINDSCSSLTRKNNRLSSYVSPLTSFSLGRFNYQIKSLSEKVTLKANGNNGTIVPVTWTSSNEQVATVSNGVVVPKKAGFTYISAIHSTLGTQRCLIYVSTLVTLSNGCKEYVGDLDRNGKLDIADANLILDTTKYNESDRKLIADIDGNGVINEMDVNALKRIYTSHSFTLVYKPISAIKLNKANTEIVGKGETERLIASIIPSDTTDNNTLTWSSSNEDVAKVDSNGKVTAISEGTATITVNSNYKPSLKASCIVKISIPKALVDGLPFIDITEGVWYVTPLKYMYSNKYVSGTSNVHFSPNVNLSRGMLVTILYNIEGNPEVAWTNKFSDVKDGRWYTSAVMWASQNRVVSGYANGTFLPDANITRQEVAVMLSNYYRFKTGKKDIEVSGSLTGYQDIKKISSWAKQSIQWAVNNQIISGKSINSKKYIDPQGKATRAEAITMIYRYLNKNK